MGVLSIVLRELMAAGLTGDALVSAIGRIEDAQQPTLSRLAYPVDEAAERRREWDRKRKASLPRNWSEITQFIFERDNFTCVYCGSQDWLQCDHVMPLSRGGSSEPENLATACRPCNGSKGARTPEEWGGPR